MWHNASAKTRLFGLAALALVSLTLISAIGLGAIHSLAGQMESALHRQGAATRALVDIESSHARFKIQVQEWKNILLRGNDPAAYEKYLAQFGEEEARVQKHLQEAAALFGQLGMARGDLDKLASAHRKMGEEYRAALASYDKADILAGQKVDKLVKGKDRAASQAMDKLVKDTEEYAARQSADDLATAHALRTRMLAILGIPFLVGAAIVGFVAATIVRSLLRQLGGDPAEAAAACRRIADGDLSAPMRHEAPDSVLGAMAAMQEKLRGLVGNVRSNADLLVQSATQLSSSSQNVAASIAHQRDLTSGMAASVEEITVSVAHIHNNAETARTIAGQGSTLANTGEQSTRNAAGEMERITAAVGNSAEMIRTLGNQSEEISTIVGTIREIADQTNLLALNAAIEAARAGESGRGFAVVADEVRKLAERTATSTSEIAGMIERIQNGTRNAVATMEDATHLVDSGTASIRNSAATMGDIATESGKILTAVTDISSALDEQRIASTDVARNIEGIAAMNERNAAAAEQISSTTGDLTHMAENLRRSIAQFRLAAA